MERDDLTEQWHKQYTQFVNWTHKYVCGNEGAILSGAVMSEHNKIIKALADKESNKDLIKAVKEVKDWMDFIRNKSKTYKTNVTF